MPPVTGVCGVADASGSRAADAGHDSGDPVHGRARHRDRVEALEIVGNPSGAKMVGCRRYTNLADDRRRRGARRAVGPPRAIAQAGRAVGVEPLFPFVERLPRDAEMSAGPGHVPLRDSGPEEHLEPPGGKACLFRLRHRSPCRPVTLREESSICHPCLGISHRRWGELRLGRLCQRYFLRLPGSREPSACGGCRDEAREASEVGPPCPS